jgi:hypothetical protein
MSAKVSIELSSGQYSVTMFADYRWYYPGEDNWSCPSPGYLGTDSGSWYYSSNGVNTGVVFNGQVGGNRQMILYIRDLPAVYEENPFKVGYSGIAHHNIHGKLLPNGPVNWRVINIT